MFCVFPWWFYVNETTIPHLGVFGAKVQIHINYLCYMLNYVSVMLIYVPEIMHSLEICTK